MDKELVTEVYAFYQDATAPTFIGGGGKTHEGAMRMVMAQFGLSAEEAVRVYDMGLAWHIGEVYP